MEEEEAEASQPKNKRARLRASDGEEWALQPKNSISLPCA